MDPHVQVHLEHIAHVQVSLGIERGAGATGTVATGSTRALDLAGPARIDKTQGIEWIDDPDAERITGARVVHGDDVVDELASDRARRAGLFDREVGNDVDRCFVDTLVVGRVRIHTRAWHCLGDVAQRAARTRMHGGLIDHL